MAKICKKYLLNPLIVLYIISFCYPNNLLQKKNKTIKVNPCFTQQTAIEAYQRLEHWKRTNSDITQSDIIKETENFMAMFP